MIYLVGLFFAQGMGTASFAAQRKFHFLRKSYWQQRYRVQPDLSHITITMVRSRTSSGCAQKTKILRVKNEMIYRMQFDFLYPFDMRKFAVCKC